MASPKLYQHKYLSPGRKFCFGIMKHWSSKKITTKYYNTQKQ